MCGRRARESSARGSAWHCRAWHRHSWHCHIWHRHIWHQEQVSGNWCLSLLTLQDLVPFPVLPQGFCGTCSRSQAGAEGTGPGAQESRPCPGVATKPLHLCRCSPSRPGLGERGGAAFMALSWAIGPGGGFGGRFTQDWEEVGPLNPVPKQTARRAGCASCKGDGEGAGKGGSVISRALTFNP